MAYSHADDTSDTADQMLSHPGGEGQCTAWADLWTQVVEAQGIGAVRTSIEPGVPFIGFCVKLVPAQGTSGANYVPGTISDPGFSFHQVVRVDGFADTIFDPSYGTRTDKTDARSVELKYEDDNITYLLVAGQWILDTKGLAELVFTP
jgi:hypothetical protein